jgi:hypothetical protein
MTAAEYAGRVDIKDTVTKGADGLILRPQVDGGRSNTSYAVTTMPDKLVVALGRRGGGKTVLASALASRGWRVVPFMEPRAACRGRTLKHVCADLTRALNDGVPAVVDSFRTLLRGGQNAMRDAMNPEALDLVTAGAAVCEAIGWPLVWIFNPTSRDDLAFFDFANAMDGSSAVTLLQDRGLLGLKMPDDLKVASKNADLLADTVVREHKKSIVLKAVLLSRFEHQGALPAAVRCSEDAMVAYERRMATSF